MNRQSDSLDDECAAKAESSAFVSRGFQLLSVSFLLFSLVSLGTAWGLCWWNGSLPDTLSWHESNNHGPWRQNHELRRLVELAMLSPLAAFLTSIPAVVLHRSTTSLTLLAISLPQAVFIFFSHVWLVD